MARQARTLRQASPSGGHRRRAVVAGAAILLVVAVVVGGLLLSSWRQRSSQLNGPLLANPPLAPPIALKDQDGQAIQLADLRGKVVAVTFLYTNCPDACPLIAAKLAKGWRQLGADQRNVVMLAVSVDPANDTPDSAKKFNAEYGLQPPFWHYLLGSAQELVPVWTAYHVDSGAAAQVAGAASKGGSLIDHTGIVYLLDRQQRVRVALDVEFQPSDFTHDVQVLAHA